MLVERMDGRILKREGFASSSYSGALPFAKISEQSHDHDNYSADPS